MKTINFKDIKSELKYLNQNLSNSLKEEKLCIAKLNHDCDKLKSAEKVKKSLCKAKYVIFSKDMVKYHNYESFLFLDEFGAIVDVIHGNEFWLYDMIEIYNINKEKEFKDH